MCLEHHDEYDTQTSQSKGLTRAEAIRFRSDVHQWVGYQLGESASVLKKERIEVRGATPISISYLDRLTSQSAEETWLREYEENLIHLSKELRPHPAGELVRSIRGAKGGYTLAMPAERLTLAEIIAVIEGPIRFVQCTGRHSATDADCDLLDVCPVKRPVQRIHEKLSIFLEQITLAGIVSDAEGADRIVDLSVDGAVIGSAPVFAKYAVTRTEA